MAVDLVFGTIALALAAVPMLAIAVAVLIDGGAPALLRQRRIGIHGNEYLMWKFRTLPVGTPQLAKSELLRVGLRPTRIGAVLRRFSLDELPQLINVVKGDMSLVGPRPALYTQDDLVRMRREAGVLRVKPGITGLAQVSGGESLSLQDKVALDAEYMLRMSPWLDLQIVLKTAGTVLRSRGRV